MVGTLAVRELGNIHVKYRGTGLKAKESFSVAVIAVIRQKADILGNTGKMIFPGKAVICQRIKGLTQEDCRQAGTPVTVLDPGEDHLMFILPNAKASKANPIRTIQKESTRPVGTCTDADPQGVCKSCCNCSKHHRRKK